MTDMVTTDTSNTSGRREAGALAEAAAASGHRPVAADASEALIRVLDEIRLGGARSRSAVIVRTGLTRSVVAHRVGDLLDRGLIIEEGTVRGSGGRPPSSLRFNATAGHVLSADIGITSIDVGVASLDGRILGHREEPADAAAGPEACLGKVEELYTTISRETPGLPGRLWGIGIDIPGSVDFRTGRPISQPTMPTWAGFPVREHLESRFGVPAWIDNDANAAALGEWRFGVARGHDNAVFLKVGTGIGAGIISDGRLHRGAQWCAGDVGHIQVCDDPAVTCRCGNRGCVEALASGAAIARNAEAIARAGTSRRLKAALDRHGSVTAKDVAAAAAHGDPVASELIDTAGRNIGAMLASVVNFYNPSLIVLGGGVARSGDRLLASVREAVYRRSLPLATRDLLVKGTSLGSMAGVVGCATMVVDELFSRETFSIWAALGDPSGMVQATDPTTR